MRLPLRFKLLILVGVTSIPMLIALGLMAKTWRDGQLLHVQTHLLTHAALTVERLTALQDQAALALKLLATEDWQPHEPATCLRKVQQALAALPALYANLVVIGLDGQVLCNAKAPEKRHSLADRDYVRRALATQSIAISGLIIGRTTGTPAIGLAIPHKTPEGGIDYLLGTSIELGEVTRELGQRLPQDAHWWLLDADNRVLASHDVQQHPIGQRLDNPDLLRTLGHEAARITLRHTDAQGQLWLISQLRIGESVVGDRIVLAHPADSALQPVNTTVRLTLLAILAALLLALALAWLVARRFSARRIEPLLTALHRIEHGDFDVRLPPQRGHDELDRLTAAIEHMAKTLKTQEQRIQAQQATLVYQAQHDPLTGLPNRLMLANTFPKAALEAKRHGEHMALMILDLDHFKTINEGRGHALGDRILVAVASRLQENLRETDTLARIGGDEFLILLERIPGPEAVLKALKRIQKAFSSPFEVAGERFELTTSIGIALFPDDGEDFERLMQQADAALHQCKAEERSSYRFYAAHLTQAAEERLATERLIRDALRLGWFTLHYQPQVELASGRRLGVEALLRLNHPEQGLIPPGRFIPVAEEGQLIVAIGTWVIKEACQQMARWRRAGEAPAYVAVNIAARQILHDDLPATVAHALRESGIPPAALELEITEASFLKHSEEVQAKLMALRALGVRLALDDFGTGYSSLAYLPRLPLDRLKIDQSFVRDMLNDAQDEAIVRAIIQLGQALRLEVVAEGVETEAQAAHLLALGCPLGQGYLFGRPAPAA